METKEFDQAQAINMLKAKFLLINFILSNKPKNCVLSLDKTLIHSQRYNNTYKLCLLPWKHN